MAVSPSQPQSSGSKEAVLESLPSHCNSVCMGGGKGSAHLVRPRHPSQAGLGAQATPPDPDRNDAEAARGISWHNDDIVIARCLALDLDDLTARVAPRIARAGFAAQPVDDVLTRRIATLRGRARLLEEFVTAGAVYWTDASDLVHAVETKGFKKWMKAGARPILEAALEVMTSLDDWTPDALETALTPLLARFEIGMGKLAQPIRCSITGTPVSPGLFETLEALGKEQTLPRMVAGIAICAAKEQV